LATAELQTIYQKLPFRFKFATCWQRWHEHFDSYSRFTIVIPDRKAY